MKKTLVALLMAIANLNTVYAAQVYCSGEVTQLYVTASGNLNIKGTWRNHYTRICNLKSAINNIDILTCSVWSSYFTAAINNKKLVTVKYLPDEGVTCATLATYSNAPRVDYVMLKNTDVQ